MAGFLRKQANASGELALAAKERNLGRRNILDVLVYGVIYHPKTSRYRNLRRKVLWPLTIR
ncbi:MAG: hypothetical protein HOD16_04255 [Nitrospina sp.]|nr:hypothetical protein [Nitrospina sp.]